MMGVVACVHVRTMGGGRAGSNVCHFSAYVLIEWPQYLSIVVI